MEAQAGSSFFNKGKWDRAALGSRAGKVGFIVRLQNTYFLK